MMNNKEFGQNFEKRTLDFAIRIIKLSGSLPQNLETNVIRNQITKSGTSVGANYREANRARSKADFRNKIKICESEANETIYWIEIIKEMNWLEEKRLISILKEAKELIAILSTISKSLASKVN